MGRKDGSLLRSTGFESEGSNTDVQLVAAVNNIVGLKDQEGECPQESPAPPVQPACLRTRGPCQGPHLRLPCTQFPGPLDAPHALPTTPAGSLAQCPPAAGAQ